MKSIHLYRIPLMGSLLLLLLLQSCAKKNFEGYPNTLSDGFENAATPEDLLKDQGGEWSAIQLSLEANEIIPLSGRAHTGSRALKCTAAASTDEVSKCSIFNNELTLKEGEIFHFTAWYYLEGDANVDYLFLADLEERVSIGPSPGIRIALAGPEGYLVLERGKIAEKTIHQEAGSERSFPRDQWVYLEWRVEMQRKKRGSVRVWQDNRLLIEATDIRTMPRDRLYVVQGTKGIYSNIEVGITANTKESDVTLWVDDVEVWTE